MKMKAKLTDRQEAFAQAVVRNGGDRVAAFTEAGYSTKGNPNTLKTSAATIFHKPKVFERIEHLQAIASKKVERKFATTVNDRIGHIMDVITAGKATYTDKFGNERPENLLAVNNAIRLLNEMLGTGRDEEKNTPIVINFIDALQAVQEEEKAKDDDANL